MRQAPRLPECAFNGSRFFVSWQLVVPALAILFAAISGFSYAPQALAAKANQIRIGGDYNYLRVPAGSGYRWCEESCRIDARCKSWTYIKPSRQCRLKRFVAPARPSKCCVSGVKKVSKKKTRREICADFASQAVDQQDENLARKCGYRGDNWSERYKKHFRGCLTLSPKQRNALRGGRKSALQRCEKNRRRTNRECQLFAQTAEDIADSAGRNNCQLTPTKWLGGFDAAYSWCRRNKDDANEDVLSDARAALSSCLRRGGGPFVKRCDNYAQRAVKQYGKARSNECGFSGSRWHDGYRAHYQWCLKVDPWDIRNETQVRADTLERCVAQGGGGGEGKVACDHYARLASEQTRSNRKQNCGLKGRRWLANYDRHLSWCAKTSKVNRDGELKYREAELSKCFERGGGPFNEACDTYAVRSLRQFEKNVARSCNYRGKYWHDSYIGHYKWCAKASRGRRSRKMLERKALLSTCKFGFKLPFGRPR